MAITYDTALQDEIALRVYNRLYAGLDTEQKKSIDNNSTSPQGAAFQALTTLRQWSRAFTGDDDAAPAEWEPWLVAEAAWLVVTSVYPDREPSYRRVRDEAMDTALSTWGNAADDATSTEGWVFSITNARRAIMRRGLKRRDRVVFAVEDIDRALRNVLYELWNGYDWKFTRQQVTATLATDGTVTVNMASSEVFEYALTKHWFYQSSSATAGTLGAETPVLSGVSADQMASLKASQLTAGRPRYFRILENSSGKQWLLDRLPDQEYTVYAEVKFKTPTLATSDDVSAAIGKFPPEFTDIIIDLACAMVMRDYGASGYQDYEARAMARRDELLPRYAAHGDPFKDWQVSDEFRDHAYLPGSPYGQIGGAM